MNQKKIFKYTSVLALLMSLYACGDSSTGTSATTNTPNANPSDPTAQTKYVSLDSQILTPSSIGVVAAFEKTGISKISVANTQSCFNITPTDGKSYTTTINSSEWWSTGQITYTVTNTCGTPQAADDVAVLLSNIKLNGSNVTTIGGIAQTGNPWTTTDYTLSANNLSVLFSTSPCEGDWCSWAQIPAGGAKTFTVSVSNSGPITSLTVDSITMNGDGPIPQPSVEPTVAPTTSPTVAPTTEPTVAPSVEPSVTPSVEPSVEPTVEPVITGNLDVSVDSSAIEDVCKDTTCNVVLNVVAPSGQQLDSATINPATNPKQTISYKNVLPGNYTISINQSTLPAGSATTYTPSNGSVSVNAGTTARGGVSISYTQPEQLGNLNINLAKVNGSDFDSIGQINGLIKDLTNAKTYPFTISLGGNYVLNNVPSNHGYSVTIQGIGNAATGAYFKTISKDNLVVKTGNTTNADLAYTAKPTTHPVTFNVTGDSISKNPSVKFADASHDYLYVQTNTVAKNATFSFPNDDSAVAVTVEKVAGYTLSTNPTPLVITPTLNSVGIDYQKNNVSNATFDYIAPFQDYNNKVVLTVNGQYTAKSLSFASNFNATAGWGNCFGTQVDKMSITTQKVGHKYVTTVAPKDAATTSFNVSGTCDIFGTNTGDFSTVLPGVVDPVVYSMSIDTVDNGTVDLSIVQPCAANGCKDPANGYVNAGYYAEWSVWGRKYNPYNMPFNNINDIIFAFIGFDKNTGNLKSLDAGADSWGLSAITRALQQYPYMHAHLSFGGWTNNDINTAPMFDKLASSQASMDNFTNQAIKLMRDTGFTGIDIDWEWWSDHDNSDAPAQAMLQFYKTLRAGIDKASKEDGKHYTLTIAVNGASTHINAMEDTEHNPYAVKGYWSQVSALMDYINIMSYDYHGAYETEGPAYFDANYAFSNVPDSAKKGAGVYDGISVNDAINSYIGFGVTKSKLVMGLPLYARTMYVDNPGTTGGLFQTLQGKPGYGDYQEGVLDYKCIVNPVDNPVTGCGSDLPIAGIKSTVFYSSTSNVEVFNQYGRDALAPWGYSADTHSFLTYDDKWAAVAKTSKVIERGLGGTMYWELDGDSPDPQLSIIQAVKDRYNQ